MHKLIELFMFSKITVIEMTRYFKVISIVLLLISIISYSIALYVIFFITPDDFLQKELVKILYIHVPSAWLSILFYILLGVSSIVYLITKNINYDIFASVFAEISIFLTIIALLTGAIWGKPAWGTYWVWDARLTSMFIQFLMLLGYILFRMNLSNTINKNRISLNDDYYISRNSSILAIFGLLNIPIIKFSVNYWNTLHQPSTFNAIIQFRKPSIDIEMLYPLPFTLIGLFCFCAAMFITRLKIIQIQKKLSNIQNINI